MYIVLRCLEAPIHQFYPCHDQYLEPPCVDFETENVPTWRDLDLREKDHEQKNWGIFDVPYRFWVVKSSDLCISR
jgi:hypothetical protein